MDSPIDPREVPVRFSNLKQMAKSPAHYLWAVQNGTEQTLSMRLGSGVHAHLFDQPIAIFTGKVRNGANWKQFQRMHSHKTILSVREYDYAATVARAVKANRDASGLLFGNETVRETQVDALVQMRSVRCTPDVRHPSYIVDLKTTKCSEPERFNRDGVFMAYHAQLAWYLDTVVASGLGTPSAAFIVAVESTPPHPVTVLELTDQAIEQGRKMCRVWFERLLGCERANAWPGYTASIAQFDVPQADEEFTLNFGQLDEARQAAIALQPDVSASFADEPEDDGTLSEEDEGRIFQP